VRQRVRAALERRRRGRVEGRLEQDLIREAAGAQVLRATGLRPMVLPVVMEV
jgi:hypothetical protein